MMAVLSIVIGYAVGAIPISYLVGRMAGRNLLTEGSGGVSGTAAIERLGLLIGSAAGLADALKPVVVVLVAQRVGGYEVSAAAGIAAVVGHIWPVTLRFRGGRGIGPAGGVLAALGAWHMVLAFAGLILGKVAMNDSAPGVLIGFVLTAIVLSLIGSSETLVFTGWVVLGLLVVGRLVGYRKKVPPRDVSFASLFWRRLFLDRDHN